MNRTSSARRVVVVGGGAGGLAAAVAAGRTGARVTILEKANRVGKKLLRTGNGRCNLSNRNVSPEHYNRPDFVTPVLTETDCGKLLDFFAGLGLWTVADGEGRIYPLSDTAASVLDVLRLGCESVGAEEICSTEVTAVLPGREGGFRVITREQGELAADRVIVASGGGTALLRPLGHPLVPFTPALCPLKTDVAPIRGLSGLRVRCRATLLRSGRSVMREEGEILFRDFGVSGILALNLSRRAREGDVISLDLLPGMPREELIGRLEAQRALGRPNGDIFTGIFHRRVGENILRRAGSGESAALADAIRDFSIPVTGLGDIQNAQVTRGGAAVESFDPASLESRILPGLYGIGEALDIDGECGGFNLHWAFASGLAAGRSAGA